MCRSDNDVINTPDRLLQQLSLHRMGLSRASRCSMQNVGSLSTRKRYTAADMLVSPKERDTRLLELHCTLADGSSSADCAAGSPGCDDCNTDVRTGESACSGLVSGTTKSEATAQNTVTEIRVRGDDSWSAAICSTLADGFLCHVRSISEEGYVTLFCETALVLALQVCLCGHHADSLAFKAFSSLSPFACVM